MIEHLINKIAAGADSWFEKEVIETSAVIRNEEEQASELAMEERTDEIMNRVIAAMHEMGEPEEKAARLIVLSFGLSPEEAAERVHAARKKHIRLF